MAKGIDFEEANFTFGPPEGMTEEDCHSLRVFRDTNAHQIVSKWELSLAELEEVIHTGVVWLYVFGDSLHPVYVTGAYPFVTQQTKATESATFEELQDTEKF